MNLLGEPTLRRPRTGKLSKMFFKMDINAFILKMEVRVHSRKETPVKTST